MMKRSIASVLIIMVSSILIYLIIFGFIRWDVIILFVIFFIISVGLAALFLIWRAVLSRLNQYPRQKRKRIHLAQQVEDKIEYDEFYFFENDNLKQK